MSTKVTVSCDTQEELETVLHRLHDITERIIYPHSGGKYLRAYVHIGYRRNRKKKAPVDNSEQKRYNDSAEAIEIMDVESKYPIS